MHPFLKVAMECLAVPLASTCSQGCDWVVNMSSPRFLSLGTVGKGQDPCMKVETGALRLIFPLP